MAYTSNDTGLILSACLSGGLLQLMCHPPAPNSVQVLRI
jgi:hypothetical protein